jgi:uncharacterized protein (DUF302 family)
MDSDLAPANPGVVTLPSPFPFDATLERVERTIQARGLTLFARIDHGGGARAAGLEMGDSVLLIFGDPRSGTPLMVAEPLIALELPLKALVWADGTRVWVSHPDVHELGRRYGVPEELIANIAGLGLLLRAALGS